MDYVLCLILGLLSIGCCADVQNTNNETQVPKRETTIRDLMACGLTRDVSCFLDTADVIVEESMDDVLAQADQEVSKTSGRADNEESPSQLSKTINRIITELTEMFKESFSGFFKSGRESEDEEKKEETEEENSQERKMKGKAAVAEPRKKKKIKKLIGLIKLVVLGLIIKAKITLLLKALSAALQVKFFLVALAGLILNAVRFYLDLKKGHQPQKVIYYEHAQHQHHYEGEDDWGSSGPGGGGGGYWGRSYDEEDTAQDLAYAKQKPTKKQPNNNSFSWFG